MKNTTMIQLNRIQVIGQTPSHVENTKMLSPASLKVELLTASEKKYFQKRRLDTNPCQASIDVKYKRD